MAGVDSYVMDCIREANIDYAKTLERFCGNSDMLLRFLVKFPQDDSYVNARNFCKTGDGENYRTSIHTLKGLVGNLGITDVYTVCADIQQVIDNGDFEKAYLMFENLTEKYNKAIAAIQKLALYIE